MVDSEAVKEAKAWLWQQLDDATDGRVAQTCGAIVEAIDDLINVRINDRLNLPQQGEQATPSDELLEIETRVFENNRGKWIADGKAGLWVMIRSERPFGFYDTLERAVVTAQNIFGDESVFIRQVFMEDRIEVIERVRF